MCSIRLNRQAIGSANRGSANLCEIERLAVTFEHDAAEQLALRPPQAGVGGDQLNRGFASQFPAVAVGYWIGVAQFAEAVLAGAEKFAGAAEADVLLGQGKTIGRARESF